MPSTFSGALQPKKKGELQEIAEALLLATSGTKDDLQTRIKEYLDANDLSDNPVFSGLYVGRRKTRKESIAPVSTVVHNSPSDEEEPTKAVRKTSTRKKASSPALHHDSTHLSPTSVPLPPSPLKNILDSVENAVATAVPDSKKVVEAVKQAEGKIAKHTTVARQASKKFLSNATNLNSVTVLAEFLYLLYLAVPWAYYKIQTNTSTGDIAIPYPPSEYLLSAQPYKDFSLWFVLSAMIPQFFGSYISFTTPRKDIDPLSAAIVRLALVYVLPSNLFVVGGDWVSKLRITSAATTAAFAVAEAIQERRVVTRDEPEPTSQALVPANLD